MVTEAGWRPLRKPTAPGPAAFESSPFSRLALTHALVLAGDALITLALAGSLFFDISPDAARGKVALSLVLTMAPFAVVAPFLGPLVDRARGGRRAMVLGSALGRAGLCLGMAATIDGLALFPAAFASLVLSKAYSVAKSALVPAVVGSEEELVEANAKLALAGVVAGLLAAVPGVAVLQLFGGAWVLRLAAVVFSVAAGASLRLVRPQPGSTPPEVVKAELRERAVVLAVAAMAVLRAGVGFLTFLVAFDFRRRGAASWWFGLVLAASMVGTFFGAVAAPRLRGMVREEHILVGALALTGAAAGWAARAQTRVATALLAGVVGLAASAGKLAFDSLVQRDAPDAVQGRAFARFEAVFQLVWVLGALVPVAVTFPVGGGFVVLAGVASAAAVGYAVARVGTGVRTGARKARPGRRRPVLGPGRERAGPTR